MNKKNLLILLIEFVVVLGGVFLIFSRNKGPQKSVSVPHPEYKITPIIAPFVEIQIDDKGFSPNEITTDIKHLLHFINNTDKTVEIEPSGENKIVVAVIAPGKTGISLPLFKAGEYKFVLKNKAEVKGKIIVR